MSTDSNPVNQILDQYRHRTRESVKNHLDAEGILEGYLEHQGVDNYKFMESEFPYHASLGRIASSEGEVVLTSHYTYPSGSSFSRDVTRAMVEVEDLDEAMDEILDNERVLDGAGAEIQEDLNASTSSGLEVDPSTVHCIVFYDQPVVSAVEDTEYDHPAHQKAAMQSLNEPSIGTAVITAGREKAGAQVDYWTRTVDGVEENGLDYSQLDWENPIE